MKNTRYSHADSQEKLARYCSSIGNPTRVAIVEAIAEQKNCGNDIYEVSGLSKFTVGANLKALKKHGLLNGTLGIKKVNYCIDNDKLEEFKVLFDKFYIKVMANKEKVNPTNESCQ